MHVMILFLFRTKLWKKVHRYFIQTKAKTCLVVVPDFEFIFKNLNVVRPLLNLLPTGITAGRLGTVANVFCGSHLELSTLPYGKHWDRLPLVMSPLFLPLCHSTTKLTSWQLMQQNRRFQVQKILTNFQSLIFVKTDKFNPFNDQYLLEGHTYLNKPAAERCRSL